MEISGVSSKAYTSAAQGVDEGRGNDNDPIA